MPHDHTSVLRTLDPADPRLSDLEPLRAATAGARVVGIGEGAHFVREFTLARARLLRFLVERCGFTVLALELGALEAEALAPWLAGAGDDAELPEHAAPLTIGVFGELLRWLRAYNRTRPEPLRTIGIDLPNTLTLAPDLARVAGHLRTVDPPAAATLGTLLEIAGTVTGGSAVVSAGQWATLEPALQDALTAGLARLSFRLAAMRPLHLERARPEEHAAALRHLAAARHTDYQLRAMNGLFTGDGLPCDPSLREHFMATTVREQLAGERVVLVAHNSHLQKTPVSYDGELAALPMGHHLVRDLGDAYRVVALTHTGARVPEMAFPAEHSPVGFTVGDVDLPAPPEGTIERALLDAGLGNETTLTDLRTPGPPLTGIRAQSAVTDTDVRAAFDLVLSTPAATRDATVPF